MFIDIDIFWYTPPKTIINDNTNGILQKLEFVSKYEVKELIKGNRYDNLKIKLNQETELNIDESPIKNEHDKLIKRTNELDTHIATLKSAEVIDYEANYLDDGSISSHKYIIVAQDIQIEKQWPEKYTDFTNK